MYRNFARCFLIGPCQKLQYMGTEINKTDIFLNKISMYISFSSLCHVTLFYLQD